MRTSLEMQLYDIKDHQDAFHFLSARRKPAKTGTSEVSYPSPNQMVLFFHVDDKKSPVLYLLKYQIKSVKGTYCGSAEASTPNAWTETSAHSCL